MKVQLGREVRFSLPVDDVAEAVSGGVTNSFAGWPRPSGLAPNYRVVVEATGRTDPRSGYLVNIKQLDEMVRTRMLPLIADRVSNNDRHPGSWLIHAWPILATQVAKVCDGELTGLTLLWTDHHRFAFRGEQQMIYFTEQFEFAAAHRLWSDQLSADENLQTFGKCANPNGHGHNYLLEVTVAGRPEQLAIGNFERTVRDRVVDAFDHKHLNLDCAEFADTNPTVENIARVIYDRLAAANALGDALRGVRLYETQKTYAEYHGEDS